MHPEQAHIGRGGPDCDSMMETNSYPALGGRPTPSREHSPRSRRAPGLGEPAGQGDPDPVAVGVGSDG